MELNHLRYFFEVAKSGSFTEAARRLHVSQSALSKAVFLLEDGQGVKLFVRSKQGVRLTEKGQQVFAQAEALFRLAREIEQTFKGGQSQVEGLLRFGSSDHIANYLLPEPVARFRNEFADCIPSITTGAPGELAELILKQELEFGLFFTKVNSPSLNYISLKIEPMTVVTVPRHAHQARDLKTLVKNNGLIGSLKSQFQKHPAAELQAVIQNDHISLESNNQETQKKMCLAGGGVAYLARFMVEAEIERGDLKEIPLKRPIQLQLYLVTRKDRQISIAAQKLIEYIRSALNAKN